MDAELRDSLIRASEIVQNAQYLVAFTGAGISTPSGIPDFRSAGSGLWERFDPMEVASLTTFRRNPARFWEWKRPLLRQIWQSEPNAAHYALAELEAEGQLKAVITQNIDGLHQAAGSKSVLELHGTVHSMTCPACHKKVNTTLYRKLIEETEELPCCSDCNAPLKPDVVLFEENLPEKTWFVAQQHSHRADVMLIIGSGLEVWPANSLPETALKHGAKLIIVNYSPTALDRRAAVLLPMNVAEALPLIAHAAH